MSLFRPLKALKIRFFSTFQIPENCCQIRKKALKVWKFQTIKVILYSKLHFMFSHDFFHFTGWKFCPEIYGSFKLYVVIYILYSLDFIFHIFSMNFPYIPRYPYFYCSFCRHFIDNWKQEIWHYHFDKRDVLSTIFLSRVALEWKLGFHSKTTRLFIFIYNTVIAGTVSFSN